jgi:UDP-N-acetylmuramyl tripeptide synthase
VARFVDPSILIKLGARLERGAVLVTGTNGKTTTALLLRRLLSAQGPVCGNPSGANLVFGLTAALVQQTSWRGDPRASRAVFEVDELSFPRACAELSPAIVVVTNLFRDQLDRAGELESAGQAIAQSLRALPDTSVICLNADDPLVDAMAEGVRARLVRFGLGQNAPARSHLSPASDARFCPRCGAPLQFGRVSVGHLGQWRCPSCGLARSHADVRLDGLWLDGLDAMNGELRVGEQSARLRLPISGLYNAYNLLAAATAALAAGVSLREMPGLLAAAAPAFGRMESFDLQGVRVVFLLAKNPTGFDESLRFALETGQGTCFLLAINDRIADGRDVSWLWDVDFESMRGHAQQITVTGLRATDMQMRLKYAGITGEVRLVEEYAAALDEAVAAAHDRGATNLFVLTTYTAMLALREVLERRGLARPYWEETA